MNNVKLVVIIALMVILMQVAAALAGEGQEKGIIADMLTAYGGKEAVGKVYAVVAKGEINDFMKGMEGGYARYHARPGRLRIEIMPEQGGEVRILEGGRGWQGSPGSLKEARPITVQSMTYQYTYLDLPRGLVEGSYPVTYGGSQELKGRPVDLLLVKLAGGKKLRVYLDPVKHLIIRVAADFDMGMGGSELATEYEDYRPVGKVLFPFRLTNYAGTTKLSVITLTDIRINPTIPPELFQPVLSGTK